MIIGGLQKFSLLDYPDQISAIIFTQGCNFRCHFCYNPMLVWPETAGEVRYKPSSREEEGEGHTLVKEDDLFRFLKSRVGKLQAVVISGGEPTLHGDLPAFVKKIKQLGFKIKLDTNGTNPQMLEKLIHSPKTHLASSREGDSLIDYIAMDLKAPKDKYEKAVGTKVDFENIEKSVRIIMNSGLPYEFRTTVVPGILDKEDVAKIGETIQGAQKWYLQKFKSDTDLVNQDFKNKASFTDVDMEEMVKIGQKYARACEAR